MRLLVGLALRSIAQGGRRVWLLALSLGFAACLLVLVTSFFEGLRHRLISTGTAMHAGHVNVTGISRSGTGRISNVIPEGEAVAELIRKEIPGVDQVVCRHDGGVQLVGDAGTLGLVVRGIDVAAEHRLVTTLNQAVEPDVQFDPAVLQEPGALLIFQREADKLNLLVGDRVTLMSQTIRGTYNTVEAKVAHIHSDMGGLSGSFAYAHKETMRQLFGLPQGGVQQILVYLDSFMQTDATVERLQVLMGAHKYDLIPYTGGSIGWQADEEWQGNRLAFTTWRSELGYFLWRLSAAMGINFVVFVVLSLVIGAGVVNAMLIAVQMRTREIGTLRALGLGRAGTMFLFIMESMLLGAASAGMGTLVAAAMTTILNLVGITINAEVFTDIFLSDKLHFDVRPELLLQVTLGITFVSAVSCIWPALRAARMRPVIALRAED